MLASLEWRAHRARQVILYGFVVGSFERLLQIVPSGSARKERLHHAKASPVVIGIEEPGRNVIALQMQRLHRDRIEQIESEQLHLMLRRTAILITASESSIRARAFG